MERDIFLQNNIKKRSPVGVGGTGVFGTSELLLKQAVSLTSESLEVKTVKDHKRIQDRSFKNEKL